MDSIAAMLNNFRDHHPMGSIMTELLRVEEGIHFVRAQVVVNSTVLGTGMAGSHTVEDAEDAALKRALIHAGFGRASHPGSALGAWPSPGYSSYEDLPSEVPLDSSSGHNFSSHNTSGHSVSGLSGNGHRPNQPSSWDPVPTLSPLPSPPPSPARGSGELMDEEDLSDVIAQTDVEMKRVGWTPNQGRDYLVKTFGKRSRQLLEPHELMQFLRYLQQQTTRS